MEVNELSLESEIEKINVLIKNRLSSLNSTEISLLSKNIPTIPTMLQFREKREEYINNLRYPAPIPDPLAYSDDVLERCKRIPDYSKDISKQLEKFYQKEIIITKMIKEKVSERMLTNGNSSLYSKSFPSFMNSVSTHISHCEEGKERLKVSTMSTYNVSDLLLNIRSSFYKRNRESYIKQVLRVLSHFEVSYRAHILSVFFSLVQESFQKDFSQTYSFLYPSDPGLLDQELYRLAQRFCIKSSLMESDGQKYVYESEIVFMSIMDTFKSDTYEYKIVSSNISRKNQTLSSLCYNSVITQIPIDPKVMGVLETLKLRKEDIVSGIREQTRFYGSNVPEFKVRSWMQLRHAHMRFLSNSILSLLNYFEFLRNPNNYIVRINQSYPQIFVIYDQDTEVLFDNALVEYNKIKDRIIRIASYYSTRIELSLGEKKNLLDRESIVESLFEFEFRFINAKKGLIQALSEVYDHTQKIEVLQQMDQYIYEIPCVDIHLYKTFHISYEMAIKMYQQKSEIARFFVNSQILNEQQIGSRICDIIPLFKRPIMVSEVIQRYQTYPESVPISPFEVYPSLNNITRILDMIQSVSIGLSESLDIKDLKFIYFIELAVYNQITNCFMTHQISFPYIRPSSSFHFSLSDTVNSLFQSVIVNRIDSLESLIEGMNEGRKLRYVLAIRKFLLLCWSLQEEIFLTDVLQFSYYGQCDELSITDRSVLLSPFLTSKLKDVLDMSPSSNDKVIDFALTEFEEFSFNFCSVASIKPLLGSSDFSSITKLLKFQVLHNSILLSSTLFNTYIMNSFLVVKLFELTTKKTDVFLTDIDNGEQNENHQQFTKQFVAPQLFNNSTTCLRDYQQIIKEKNIYINCIGTIKNRMRSGLVDPVSQKFTVNSADEYMNHLIDSFVSTICKYEIAHICNLEKSILQSNSFVDTFIIGPIADHCLINDAGRIEHFFYVPSFLECYSYMLNTPQPIQNPVMKNLRDFIYYRFLILSLIRFECSLEQKQVYVYDSLYSQRFQMESMVFAKMDADLLRIPNSQEVDISTSYMSEKYSYYFYRLEITILSLLDHFEASINEVSSGIKNPTSITALDQNLFENSLKQLWKLLHINRNDRTPILSSFSYTPTWQNHFLFDSTDLDRLELSSSFSSIDKAVEEAVHLMKGVSIMESYQLITASIDFMKVSITHYYYKFFYLLLLSKSVIDQMETKSIVISINKKIYLHGQTSWNDVIVKLNPKYADDNLNRQIAFVDYKQLISIIDRTKLQIDLMILSDQIKYVNEQYEVIEYEFGRALEKNSAALRPSLRQLIRKNSSFVNPTMSHKPEKADSLFFEELKYCIARIVNMVFDNLDSSTLERRNHDGTFTTIYDSSVFEESCARLSTSFKTFSTGSLEDLATTWSGFLHDSSLINTRNKEEIYLLELYSQYIRERYQRWLAYESLFRFEPSFLVINQYQSKLNQIKSNQSMIDHQITNNINNEYVHLVNDLKTEIVYRKNDFVVKKRSVINNVIKKVNGAKEIKLENSSISRQSNSRVFNPKDLDIIQTTNSSLKKDIQKLRIMRCLNDVALKRMFRKKTISYENERRDINMSYWTNRVDSELRNDELQKQLKNATTLLFNTEIQIEKLKSSLENEKMSNIQLVHWKAKNESTITQLKDKIQQLDHFGDNNIDELLQKLLASQEELDKITEETDYISQQMEDSIRKPMGIVDKMRHSLTQMKTEQLASIERATSRKINEEKPFDSDLQKQSLIEENNRLKAENALMKEHIESILKQKKNKDNDQIQFMENANKPKSPLMKTLTKSGTIIKPFIIPKQKPRQSIQ